MIRAMSSTASVFIIVNIIRNIIQEKTLFPTNNYNMLIMQNINTVQSF